MHRTYVWVFRFGHIFGMSVPAAGEAVYMSEDAILFKQDERERERVV